jgi:hypothetical protein
MNAPVIREYREYAERRLSIISGGPPKGGPYTVPLTLACVAALAGIAAWVFYLQQDLVLSHYDAKAHLVVSRRIIDSLTPGWRQVGAVWLPLPHLLQMLPVQIDVLYQTGAFGSGLSIACLAITVWAFARVVLLLTGSVTGTLTSAALVVGNPNLLYLFATPMTEPLLVATCALSVLWTVEWLREPIDAPLPSRLAVALFAAAWTRYEAWPVLAVLLALVAVARGRRAWTFAAWPATAVLLFLANGRLSTGVWFVTGGFYVRDPMYHRRPLIDAIGVWWGANELSGYVSGSVALIIVVLLVRRARAERSVTPLIPLALLAAAALPFYALFEGHPYRIRYMVPIVAAYALLCGVGVGLLRRRATPLAMVLVASSLIESPVWNQRAPLLEEARWDVPASLNRREVRRCLARDYRGDLVLASMGSLAHLMQELSRDRLDIADFIHEGNGSVWELALETGPAPHAGWMLVEEESEGGDVLARKIRDNAAFAAGMTRVCEGGGVALYRRASSP